MIFINTNKIHFNIGYLKKCQYKKRRIILTVHSPFVDKNESLSRAAAVAAAEAATAAAERDGAAAS